MDAPRGPLEEPAGEWFVNRREELDLFWQWATGVPHPDRRSFALVGLRRTGKTAILHKLFNRLFYEQTRVLPIYISFARYLNRPTPLNSYEFAEEYFASYLRSYLAFRHRRPELLEFRAALPDLRVLIGELADEVAQSLMTSYDRALTDPLGTAYGLVQWLIDMPRGVATVYNIPTAVIIDEFQVLTNVYNPDQQLHNNLTDSFQQAAESRSAPLLISGSSISMLMGDALGGMLSGRFASWYLGPLAQEHALDLIFRLGQTRKILVTQALALAIWEVTQGYPYSIERIMVSLSPAVRQLPEVNALKEIILFELTDKLGALREHYEHEYGKYMRAFNGDHTARKILFWITTHPDARIAPDIVAAALGMDILQVQEALEKLYRADVIQRATISSFQGPTDPLLREFLRYEHYLDVENLTESAATTDLRKQLNAKIGESNRQTGHFTEIIVAGVLNNFDNRAAESQPYFSVPGTVNLPRMEKILRREGVVKEGIPHEIDVIGEYKLYNGLEGNASLGAWLVAVRYRGQKMGVSDVTDFSTDVTALQDEKQYGEVTRWYFSKAGFTEAAIQQLQEQGTYFSDLKQFNALAARFGLLPLTM
ncbi:MAG: hypothetical protein R3C14_53540 [Caldilineaceae bacterium]